MFGDIGRVVAPVLVLILVPVLVLVLVLVLVPVPIEAYSLLPPVNSTTSLSLDFHFFFLVGITLYMLQSFGQNPTRSLMKRGSVGCEVPGRCAKYP